MERFPAAERALQSAPMDIPFQRDFSAPYETLEPVAPHIRRLLANNPSPFTFRGTGVYVVGDKTVAVIDPGPDTPAHLDALKRALEGFDVSHILITHTHADHSPAARPLRDWTGAKTYGYGPHSRTAADEPGLEEGGDLAFVPDVMVRDGDTILGDGFTFDCVYTPGHTSNHMCYALGAEQALFTGDHVMGWSTSVVIPPDGDMAEYLASLRKLLWRDDRIYWPTHGGPVRDPKSLLETLIAHREAREAQILACIRQGRSRIADMVRTMYADVDPRLYPAAAMSVLAHLIKLVREGRVACNGAPALSSHYRLA
jgi:glyoxylase-like metal-dependent hydrolase (beta-lactamase superfamily II)